jgi:hypothetical protein
MEPPIPKTIELPHVPENDVCSMKRYLCEYWSVGELRLFDDMSRSGMKDVNEVLKEVIERGYASLAASSVINATEKLLKEGGGKAVEGVKKVQKPSDLM